MKLRVIEGGGERERQRKAEARRKARGDDLFGISGSSYHLWKGTTVEAGGIVLTEALIRAALIQEHFRWHGLRLVTSDR